MDTYTSGSCRPELQRSLLIPTRYFRGLSGKVILLRYNIPALVAAGWRVHVLAEKIDIGMTRELGAEPHRIWGRGINKRHKVTRFMHQAERFVRKQDVGLVVSHGDTLYQDILHIHNCRHREYEEFTGRTLQPGEKATGDLQARQLAEGGQYRVVANSRLMRDDLCQRFDLDPSGFEVIYPGYDPERFYPEADSAARQKWRNRLGLGNEVLVGLITSGKFHLRGADLLIEAVARLPENLRKRLKLLVVGKGDTRSFVVQARQAGLADQLHMMGPIDNVEELYKSLDIYVNPSRFDTFSMSVLEAMACGIPSITTRKVGIYELFNSDMQAGVMPVVDAAALSACLETLLADDELRSRHAQNGIELAAPLTWARNIQAHRALYDAVYEEKLGRNQ